MSHVTARQCANSWGLSDSYARRVLAGVAPVGRNIADGALLYDQQAADGARASLPGRGHRSDLAARGSVPTIEDLDRLQADRTVPPAIRAMALLLWEETARFTDLLSADVRDVDLSTRTLDLEFPAKGGPGPASFSERAAAVLREAIADETAGPLLRNSTGSPFSRETASRQLKRYSNFATHQLRLGGQIHRSRPSPTDDESARL
ncbi:hypothetical protein [Streptomyces sp. NPDC008317]|uniref:hypothetical protein n=1 Tax=Streptomyces sp. NPDC008317 TaxID=3364827 RepID=UPI0036F082FC